MNDLTPPEMEFVQTMNVSVQGNSDLIQLGDGLEPTAEIRRIWVYFKDAKFLCTSTPGRTTFRFANEAERDNMWGRHDTGGGLFRNIHLKTGGCVNQVDDLSGSDLAQCMRGATNEENQTGFPDPGQGVTLGTAGQFIARALVFEINLICETHETLRAAVAPQAWQLLNSNGLRFNFGTLQFTADGDTWILDSTDGLATGQRSAGIWVETREFPVYLSRPLLRYRAVDVSLKDLNRVPVHGPVVFCGIADKCGADFTEGFEVKGGSRTGGCRLSKANHDPLLRSLMYANEMEPHGRMNRDSNPSIAEDGGPWDVQPYPLVWLPPGGRLERLAATHLDLILSGFHTSDVGNRVVLLALEAPGDTSPKGCKAGEAGSENFELVPLPSPATRPLAELPEMFRTTHAVRAFTKE